MLVVVLVLAVTHLVRLEELLLHLRSMERPPIVVAVEEVLHLLLVVEEEHRGTRQVNPIQDQEELGENTTQPQTMVVQEL
jgi:hypothetical protein